MSIFSFNKSQRLALRKDIDELFKEGKIFYSGPMRVVFRITEDEPSGIRILISVPHKKFRNATDRNRIKRLIREAYRLNRHDLISNEQASKLQIHAAFIYTGDKINLEFKDLESSVINALRQLSSEINERIRDGY